MTAQMYGGVPDWTINFQYANTVNFSNNASAVSYPTNSQLYLLLTFTNVQAITVSNIVAVGGYLFQSAATSNGLQMAVGSFVCTNAVTGLTNNAPAVVYSAGVPVATNAFVTMNMPHMSTLASPFYECVYFSPLSGLMYGRLLYLNSYSFGETIGAFTILQHGGDKNE